ncbi:MAG: hypothetical protein GC155_11060 [Alphaproteobacteria bacterium]|nr:hypothetical protein [Alphaproteobacteria bacterium]
MTTDLQVLAWALVLAFVQILLPAGARTLQYGLPWNAGPRDEAVPPPNKLAGRLDRAEKNLFETLPLFIGAVLVAHLAGVETGRIALGAWIYFWARVVYVPIYALGIPYVRTLVWIVSIVGLGMVLYAAVAS